LSLDAVNLDLPQLIALAAALGWASGMRLYAVVFIVGAVGFAGWVALPGGLQLLQHPLVLGASFLMLLTEFVADKIPGLDTLWDAVHTFIRIPAGAALAAGVFSGAGLGDEATVSQAMMLVAALAGGTLAATAHTAKATTRAAVNTSPEPLSNIGLSLLGDAAVPVMLWLAWEQPWVFFPVLTLALLLAVVLIVVLFRFLRALWRRFVPAPRRAQA
jgi:hypothetical protein